MTYTVTWVNYNGQTLWEETNVPEGTIPSYQGVAPVKPEDDDYTYVYIGWSPEMSETYSDMTYTAQFEAHAKSVARYTILWVNYDGTLLQTTEDLEEGQIPFYIGLTPEKPEDANYTYEFIGWTPEVVAATEDTTYTATFRAHSKNTVYDLKSALPNKLLNSDGTITNMAGQSITNPVDAYKNKPAIPNKFLNPDGTYSTLDEIIPGGGGGGSDLPIGTELDIDKNTTIPSGWQEIEYDTGWVTVPLNTAKCSVHIGSGANANTNYTPKIRRIGNVVYLRGRINIQKSNITTGTANPLVTSTFDSKFLTDDCEINIVTVLNTSGKSVYNVYIGSQVRTDTNASKMCFYGTASTWSSVPDDIAIQLDTSWAVDDLTTKRIKRIS